MSEIAPFRAWRYDPARAGDLSTLIAPPYDVISPDEQRRLYACSPYNVVRIELTAAEPTDGQGAEGDRARHARALQSFDLWQSRGIVQRDPIPALYRYTQEYHLHGHAVRLTTLLASVRLHAWSAGKILRHEHTLSRPKEERLALLRTLRVNVSPIWSLYEDGGGAVARLLAAGNGRSMLASQEAIDETGIRHHVVPLSDPDLVQAIVVALADRPFFIADGHHRYETALNYQHEGDPAVVDGRDWVLMALTATNDPGLRVLPTHRLIAGVDPVRLERLPAWLAASCQVQVFTMPGDAAAFAALLARVLPARQAVSDAHRVLLLGPDPAELRLVQLRLDSEPGSPESSALTDLDVWLAHAIILEHGLGIGSESLARQANLRYTRDAAEAVAAVRDGSAQLALILPPTPVEALLAVARAGGVMPQKSTYFTPKPATGLVIRRLGDD
jgi:uncharacterized protein (DUF1015 family)